MNDLDTLRPEVREALDEVTRCTECMHIADYSDAPDIIRAELLRLARENARLNKIESLATEQRLQTEDVELYLMEVSQPDDEDAPWCDRMKSAIELLVQDCNSAVGQKNKAETELAALKARMEGGIDMGCPVECFVGSRRGRILNPFTPPAWIGKRVRLVVEE